MYTLCLCLHILLSGEWIQEVASHSMECTNYNLDISLNNTVPTPDF